MLTCITSYTKQRHKHIMKPTQYEQFHTDILQNDDQRVLRPILLSLTN